MSAISWRSAPLTLAVAVALGLTPTLASAAHALPALAISAPAHPAAPTARDALPSAAVEAPEPDVLDVDIADSGLQEQTSDRTVTPFGPEPTIAEDPALGREVASYDGTGATRYDFADGFERTAGAVTLECTVRFDDGLTTGTDESTGNFCGAKEAGGYSLTAYGSTLKMVVNIEGTYYSTGIEIDEGVWYHVTGTWDGETVALHLNGEKVAETPTEGSTVTPPTAAARQFFLGADTNSTGSPQFHGTVSVADAGIYSRALTAQEVTARYARSFADRSTEQVSFTPTSPAEGSELTSPTTLAGTLENPELLAAPLAYTLDGAEIALGDEVGAGLSAGDHVLAWSGLDAFGEEITGEFTFSSSSIPVGAGASQRPGARSAQLTATADSPTGDDLRTTFLEGDVSSATGTEQGVITPADIADDGSVPGDVELQDAASVEDPLDPTDREELESPVSQQVPALRTEIPFTQAGQTVLWRGQVDPAREVRLLLLNEETGTYEQVDASRGSSDAATELSALAGAEHGTSGTVHALVLGTDPFADDLDEPVRDGFEDPDSYDFSLLHLTDTQYLSEGATERPSAEEREVWADAYEDSYRWVAEHGEEHKLAYVAHTGDIIENWNTNNEDRAKATEEFEFASRTQEILEDTGVVHSVLPGNHDNRGGNDIGQDSLYNEYFGPERYEALAEQQSWKDAGAEYHPWKPGDNENSYTLFSAGGQDFIALNLGYLVTEEETDWASDVLDQFSERNGILLTHAYNKPSSEEDGRGGSFSQDGAIIREQLLEKHSNVALVLSGHEHGVSIGVRTDVGDPGNNVVELLADYQFYEVGSDQLGLTETGGYDQDTGLRFGAAFFRLLQFDLDRGEVSVDTYSPHLDEFGATEYDTKDRYNGHEDDFRLPVQFQGRTTGFTTDAFLGLTPSDRVIDELTHASGEQATAMWRGLSAGSPYGWFAVSRDESRAVGAQELRTLALKGEDAEGIVQLGAFSTSAKKRATHPADVEAGSDAGPDLEAGSDADTRIEEDPASTE
ncbi:LamG-like jellyroll fold domain-containing protein [Brachybacterium alimentarium]|uniref:LamG-like jellyroll fold domain-containing protein n=1 Tax=Brachybacterium alimentarium TaxID=47845 RepID=UPI003FD56912